MVACGIYTLTYEGDHYNSVNERCEIPGKVSHVSARRIDFDSVGNLTQKAL
jgi:hypothetical protein